MFIEVIPLDASIDSSGLTYFAPDRAQRDFGVGSIVEIPLRNALVFAVVARMDTEAPDTENIRSIASVICAMPILAPYEVETTLAIARRNFVHSHVALSLFLPHALLRYLEKKSFVALHTPDTSKTKRKPHKTRFVHCKSQEDLTGRLHTLMDEDVTNAIIFPDDFALDGFLRTIEKGTQDSEKWWNLREKWAPEWRHSAPLRGPSLHGTRNEEVELWTRSSHFAESLLVHDRLTETQRHKRFIDTYNREKKQIIWTRRVLYYNLSGYDRIVYVEDALCTSTMRYQHTYHNTDILDHITTSGGFETIILSTIPSIESLYKGHTGVYEFEK